MLYSRVHIDAIGYELPAESVTTATLEAELEPLYRLFNLPKDFIESLTGIIERRFWPAGVNLISEATAAAENALASAQITGRDLDVVVYAGVCRAHIEPAMACEIGHRLGVRAQAMVYDLSNACLGVLNGIVDLAAKVESGLIRSGIVIACESSREIVEQTIARLRKNPKINLLRDSLATFTGGSGAVAVVVTDGSYAQRNGHQVKSASWMNAVSHHGLCKWDYKPHATETHLFEQMLTTEAADVMRHGVELGKKTWDAFLNETNWTAKSIVRVIPHQVGKANRDQILKALDLEREQAVSTYPLLGNMGSVAVPLTAALASERGQMVTGDRVAMTGIGSGLNCLMIGVTW